MSRPWKISALLLGLIASTSAMNLESVMGQEKPNPKLSFLDGKAAGADFQIQGEYLGKLGDLTIGAQVIARGNGKFDVVAYRGGLPGAGYDPSTEKMKFVFETKDGVTKSVEPGQMMGLQFAGAIQAVHRRFRVAA